MRCGTFAGIAERKFAMRRRAEPGGSFALTISGRTRATARSCHVAACKRTSIRSQLGLLRAQLRQLDGFIFVSLSDDPPDFDEAAQFDQSVRAAAGLGPRQSGEDR